VPARRAAFLLALPALAVVIGACSNLPVRVGLQDVTIDLGAVTSTQGNVLYPSAPSAFQKPSLHVSSASIDGDVAATGLASDTSFTFYGRASDPSQDGNCQLVGNLTRTYYACPASQESAISGPVTLPADGSSKALHLSGNVLAQGANQGKLWLGATVEGGASTGATLHFTHLVASVAVF